MKPAISTAGSDDGQLPEAAVQEQLRRLPEIVVERECDGRLAEIDRARLGVNAVVGRQERDRGRVDHAHHLCSDECFGCDDRKGGLPGRFREGPPHRSEIRRRLEDAERQARDQNVGDALAGKRLERVGRPVYGRIIVGRDLRLVERPLAQRDERDPSASISGTSRS